MSKTPEELAEKYAKKKGQPWGCEEHFLAGYKAAQDQIADADKVMPDSCEHILDMSKMVDVNGWISVKDRLPEDRTKVLGVVYDQIRFGCIELISTDPGQFHWIDQEMYIDKGHYGLTHWMPIPEPPKEE